MFKVIMCKPFPGFRSNERNNSGSVTLRSNKCTKIVQTIFPAARNAQTICKLNSRFAVPAQQQIGRAAGIKREGPCTTPKRQGRQGGGRERNMGRQRGDDNAAATI